MKTHRLHANFGAQQFLQRGHGFVRRETELRGELRIFGIKFLAGVDAHAAAPVQFLGQRQQRGEFRGRIEVHGQFVQC